MRVQPIDAEVARADRVAAFRVSPLATCAPAIRRAASCWRRPPRRARMVGPSLMVGYFGNDAATTDAAHRGPLRPDRRSRRTRRPRRLHLSQPHGRRAAPRRLPGQSAGDREAPPEGARSPRAGHRRPAPRVCVPWPSSSSPTAHASTSGGHRPLRAGLANYKTPARVFAIDAFPSHALAQRPKIQRARLRDMALERL